MCAQLCLAKGVELTTLYEYLATSKGAAYKDSSIKSYSWLHRAPNIDKQPNEISGNSRIHGDVSPTNQALVIDLLVEIGVRYKLTYRELAYLLLLVRVESGFNPDAAAGTTSAAGLAQYTEATVVEATKPVYSKYFLGFDLDLSDRNVFDAQRGAYGALLSFLICKKRAEKYFPDNVEDNIYLFHHEGWYFNPTGKEDRSNVIKVRRIIKNKILSKVGDVEQLLKTQGDILFTLKTADGKPYANQPFAAVLPLGASENQPVGTQHLSNVKVVTGVTNSQGQTPRFSVQGLSEVVFSVLNAEYKKVLQYFPGRGTGSIASYKVHSGDTLASIAKVHKTTVEAIVKVNQIPNVNRISVGQVLRIPSGSEETVPAYWWRRPEMEWLASVLAPHLGAEGVIDTAAVVEHKRSHVVLPQGNKAHDPEVNHNNVVITGGKKLAQIKAAQGTKRVPHRTNEPKEPKPISVPKDNGNTKVISGLLYPLVTKATADFHTGARRFGSNRASGRKHGGIDLYAPAGTIVRAMADGKVIQVYKFYAGTSAVEIDHGSFIVRYGEIDSHPDNIFAEQGDTIKRGEKIGKVGKLIGIKVPSNMLHLEIYNSTLSPRDSPLTDKDNLPYQRRNDLIDPTVSIENALFE